MSEEAVLAIDLGTSNCALSFWQKGDKDLRILSMKQLSNAKAMAELQVLPSVLYAPHESECDPTLLEPSWLSHDSWVAGQWARARGTEVPDRTVTSAKSWLCHGGINRRDAILPWLSDFAAKLSPVQALSFLLSHMHQAAAEAVGPALATAKTVITVPASFDELARSFVIEAAAAAGLKNVSLLEEPQAAFYSWIAHTGANWREQVVPGDIVLVCDVGGGTSDFSLIAVAEDDKGDLVLNRISVGDHLLLGGDNMDLALAHVLKARLLAEKAINVDQWQFLSLINKARDAKEALLSDSSLSEVKVAIAGKGSKLIGGAISVNITRSDIDTVILEGFFPLCAPQDVPHERMALGFQEFGLPYEKDPAITRHLAKFLRKSYANASSDPELLARVKAAVCGSKGTEYLRPTALLFNGGVFQSAQIQERLKALFAHWDKKATVKQLIGTELNLAVAHGAGYFGRSQIMHEGIRIAAGTARSYYVGFESAGMAIPGVETVLNGYCVVPQGTEEGQEVALPRQIFGLGTGRKACFRFFSSSVRAGDQAGTLVPDAPRQLEEMPNVEALIDGVSDAAASNFSEVIPVTLAASVSAVGTLQLFVQHAQSPKKWQLEFNIRPQ